MESSGAFREMKGWTSVGFAGLFVVGCSLDARDVAVAGDASPPGGGGSEGVGGAGDAGGNGGGVSNVGKDSPEPLPAMDGGDSGSLGDRDMSDAGTGEDAPPRCAAFSPLGFLPSASGTRVSRATAISADGNVVVGIATDELGQERAFRWTAASGMQDLGVLSGSNESQATAVSATGAVVVGTTFGGSSRAFRWTQSQGMQPLRDLPEDAVSSAGDVSSDGSVIVGTLATSTGDRAFRWTEFAGLELLGVLEGGFTSRANDTNADGSVIVGSSDSADAIERAFRWTDSSGMENLGVLSAQDSASQATAVSLDGLTVVGNTSGSAYSVFRWTQLAGMQRVEPAGDGFGTSAFAHGTDEDGTLVVGQAGTQGHEPFLWTSDTGMISWYSALPLDVLAPGWRFRTELGEVSTGALLGVSADGLRVSGHGLNPDGSIEAFVATLGPRCD